MIGYLAISASVSSGTERRGWPIGVTIARWISLQSSFTRLGNCRTVSVPIAYTGAVADTFRGGREVIVTVKRGANGTFVGEKDSLITKCPSKFANSTSSTPGTPGN